LYERFEFHHTPKHGSWLNTAEIEQSALVRTCLARHIPDEATLKREAQAWAEERNQKGSSGRLALYHCRRPHQIEALISKFSR